jgi:hypothetical protein
MALLSVCSSSFPHSHVRSNHSLLLIVLRHFPHVCSHSPFRSLPAVHRCAFNSAHAAWKLSLSKSALAPQPLSQDQCMIVAPSGDVSCSKLMTPTSFPTLRSLLPRHASSGLSRSAIGSWPPVTRSMREKPCGRFPLAGEQPRTASMRVG